MPNCSTAVVDDLVIQREAANSLPVVRSYEERRVVDSGTGASPVGTGVLTVTSAIGGCSGGHGAWVVTDALPMLDYKAFLDSYPGTTAVNDLYRQAVMMTIFPDFFPKALLVPAPRRLDNEEHKVLDRALRRSVRLVKKG